jgi:hypothetical protein
MPPRSFCVYIRSEDLILGPKDPSHISHCVDHNSRYGFLSPCQSSWGSFAGIWGLVRTRYISFQRQSDDHFWTSLKSGAEAETGWARPARKDLSEIRASFERREPPLAKLFRLRLLLSKETRMDMVQSVSALPSPKGSWLPRVNMNVF